MASNRADRGLKQWAIWTPAFLCVLGLTAGTFLLRTLAAPSWLVWTYLVPAIVLAWWIAPRLAFFVVCDATHLRWRWGILHHDVKRSIELAAIQSIDVIFLPDQPTRHIRTVQGMELHGGNFTPALNRGVLLSLNDGRKLCLGLPDPDRFAAALQRRLSAPTLVVNKETA